MNFGKMRQKQPITEDTLIRLLPYSVQRQISTFLDIDKQWEKLVVLVPKRLQDLGKPNCDKRYSYLQVRLFDDKSKRPDGSPTRSILGKNNRNKYADHHSLGNHIAKSVAWLGVSLITPGHPKTPQDTPGRSSIPKRHIKIPLFVHFYHHFINLKVYFH